MIPYCVQEAFVRPFAVNRLGIFRIIFPSIDDFIFLLLAQWLAKTALVGPHCLDDFLFAIFRKHPHVRGEEQLQFFKFFQPEKVFISNFCYRPRFIQYIVR